MTSRAPLAKESTTLAESGIDLGPFTTEEASSMVEKLTNWEGDDSLGVGHRLGGLPLAITQMASVIICNHLSFEEFNQTWDEKDTHNDLLDLDGRGNADTYEKNLSTVWAIENLRHRKVLLDVIAFFGSRHDSRVCFEDPQFICSRKLPFDYIGLSQGKNGTTSNFARV
jgi:hypothetical protein